MSPTCPYEGNHFSYFLARLTATQGCDGWEFLNEWPWSRVAGLVRTTLTLAGRDFRVSQEEVAGGSRTASNKTPAKPDYPREQDPGWTAECPTVPVASSSLLITYSLSPEQWKPHLVRWRISPCGPTWPLGLQWRDGSVLLVNSILWLKKTNMFPSAMVPNCDDYW